MNGHDELREIWNSQPPWDGTKAEDLMASVQKKIRHFDRAITMRNLLECLAGGVVAVFFSWFGLRAHEALMRIGALVIAVSALWIIYFLLRYGKTAVNPDPSQNLLGYTRALIERYDHQIRLLKSVKYWYLLPMYVGLLIISAGVFLQRAKGRNLDWRDFAGPVLYSAIFAAVWWLNEVSAVGRLRKQRARLLSMIEAGELTGSQK